MRTALARSMGLFKSGWKGRLASFGCSPTAKPLARRWARCSMFTAFMSFHFEDECKGVAATLSGALSILAATKKPQIGAGDNQVAILLTQNEAAHPTPHEAAFVISAPLAASR
mgnify:CR=1 FL=1